MTDWSIQPVEPASKQSLAQDFQDQLLGKLFDLLEVKAPEHLVNRLADVIEESLAYNFKQVTPPAERPEIESELGAVGGAAVEQIVERNISPCLQY